MWLIQNQLAFRDHVLAHGDRDAIQRFGRDQSQCQSRRDYHPNEHC
jgi:hypothetical protein